MAKETFVKIVFITVGIVLGMLVGLIINNTAFSKPSQCEFVERDEIGLYCVIDLQNENDKVFIIKGE